MKDTIIDIFIALGIAVLIVAMTLFGIVTL